jgi:hypothetical protein
MFQKSLLLGLILPLLLLLEMWGLYNSIVVQWVFAAYMLLDIVPAVFMLLGAASGVYVRFVAVCLVCM